MLGIGDSGALRDRSAEDTVGTKRWTAVHVLYVPTK